MPREIFLLDLWRKYAEAAREIRVKRYGDYVKLKARLGRRLYTIRLPPDKAEELIREYKSRKEIREY
jgi:large subunit ribosomal protein L38e